MNYLITKFKRIWFLISGLKTNTAIVIILTLNHLGIRPKNDIEWLVIVICVLAYTLRSAMQKRKI